MNPDQAAEAVEKNTPTEPKEMLDWNGITAYECENCGCDVFETQNYCPYCGQRLKWRSSMNGEGYRDPTATGAIRKRYPPARDRSGVWSKAVSGRF